MLPFVTNTIHKYILKISSILYSLYSELVVVKKEPTLWHPDLRSNARTEEPKPTTFSRVYVGAATPDTTQVTYILCSTRLFLHAMSIYIVSIYEGSRLNSHMSSMYIIYILLICFLNKLNLRLAS
jgi:hypothetical protein